MEENKHLQRPNICLHRRKIAFIKEKLIIGRICFQQRRIAYSDKALPGQMDQHHG
jgi:hypothetical protein